MHTLSVSLRRGESRQITVDNFQTIDISWYLFIFISAALPATHTHTHTYIKGNAAAAIEVKSIRRNRHIVGYR